ncbi:ribonuclease H-like domain-containing protein [Tanacetum coccineum]
MAFVSSPSSTNEVNTAYGVCTANTQVSPASTQVSTASTQVSTANLSDDTVYAFLASQPNGSQLVYETLNKSYENDIEETDLKWQLALLSMRTRRFFQKTSKKITMNGSDTAGYDKSKVEYFNCHKMGHFAKNGHPQKEDQGYVDSGCSRHMTWNMSYLSDFKEFDRDITIWGDQRKENYCVLKETLTCLVAKATLDESMLWHRRLGHVNFKTINKLVKENLVRGLPSKRFENDQTYVACLKGKQHKASCIKKEFSVAKTPYQNSIVERRNRTLIEGARTMLADFKLPTTFWAEAVNTACYVQNKVLVVKPHNKTPYELFRGRTPTLSFMRPFGFLVLTTNYLRYLEFDGKSNEGFFVGYSMNSKAFRVYNIRTRKVKENLHIRFLEDKPIITGDGPKWLFDIDVLIKSMIYVPVVADTNSNNLVDGSLFDSSSKNASNDEPQPSSDARKKDADGVNKESGIDDQERHENSTQDVNTARPSINTASTNVNTGSLNINIVSPTVTTAPLEATHADFFGDETEVDMSNITTTYPVPSTPNIKEGHKIMSLDH